MSDLLQYDPGQGPCLDLPEGARYGGRMNRWPVRLLLIGFCLLAFPTPSPAPFVYRPGEGWTYEPVGGEGKWQQTRAKDQLEVAQAAFDKKAYSLALKAARRVVRVWPLSDYAPQAQYLVGRCYQAQGKAETAFKEYQKALEKYPKLGNYEEILGRQYEIANLYLAGKWFKLWGVIPIFSSMEKTADMYAKIVKNGAYSDVAPQAQMKIGAAREKQKKFELAVKAYELAADRYHDRPQVAADALYRAGLAYNKQAQKAEYDQSAAGQAIATFTDFMTLYPNDPRVPDTQKIITTLKSEQARGNFNTARFYEKYHKWNGALVYYNEVLLQDPNSPYAAEARQRIDALKKRTQTASR
jgi:outer membrane protein assembly factor BamD